MTVTLQLPPETEQKLRERAAQSGQSVERFLRQLVEREIRGGNGSQAPSASSPATLSAPPPAASLDEILAPVREEFERSGMTEEELTAFLTEIRDEVRREKRARKVP